MTHEEAFLTDILADRADDLPRRIYADWLMDRPDPVSQARGEFIHIQCDLARIPLGDPRPAVQTKRERELLPVRPTLSSAASSGPSGPIRFWARGSPAWRCGCCSRRTA